MAERKEKAIIYHSDTSSFGVQVNDFNICYAWQEPLEEPSKKDIDVYIDEEKPGRSQPNS